MGLVSTMLRLGRLPPVAGWRRGVRRLSGGDTEDDIEAGRQFADLGRRDRLEINQQQLPVQRIADAAENAVRAVLRMAVDEDLGGEQFLAPLQDFDMDMRGTARVRDRFDGPEGVLALAAGATAAEPLEVGVPLPAAAAGGM